MKRTVVSIAALLMVAGCTQPGERTGIGAATGGVIGAGLGAIVGSQTGDAGSGLLLGAVAGSTAGAVVANAFEEQDLRMREQAEMMARQDQRIAAQRAEINELRQQVGDAPIPSRSSPAGIGRSASSSEPIRLRPPVGYVPRAQSSVPRYAEPTTPTRYAGAVGSTYRAAEQTATDVTSQSVAVARNEVSAPSRPAATSLSASAPTTFSSSAAQSSSSGGVSERTLVVAPSEPAIPASAMLDQTAPDLPSVVAAEIGTSEAVAPIAGAALEETIVATSLGALAPNGAESAVREAERASLSVVQQGGNSEECVRAEGEASRAAQARESADKLFHYRRALRLCPSNPSFHSGLGDVYLSLGRRADAEFEYREALRLSPDDQVVRDKLAALR